ncbi:hypothetical protein AKJ50_01590 [candidate division MSBL1 archaeon SCGC-AAA382A13]|uniref:Dihydroorotate dehydrogenase n=1 Tax=candidate division MSBL1 archaeon SCGC-AAA382A13 TaxID=1698279 RepID=A0A133VFH8_9EURY|nr:hypothetical protein AKJ50_01590 [candidate division MSBL1 archaeon SCGC-AAA382A13]
MYKNLKTKIGSLELRNPTLLAAGILGQTKANLKRVWKSGAGGVITKSVGPEPKKGYSGPNVVETPCGLLNAMGLPNPGIENMKKEIKNFKNQEKTIIGSIFGKNVEEFKKQALRMEETKVGGIELNLSCPHAGELSLIGHDPNLTEQITNVITNETSIPVWVKLPGNTHLANLRKVAKSAEKAGADALTITNTVPGMAIDIDTETPILGHDTGGLSGPAIKPIGVRLVYEIFEKVGIPIIGAGGITKGKDLIEYVLAGASAVQIGTGIIYRDIDIFEKICEETLTRLNGQKIENLIGKAH